jgi:nucleotide-binding universal stress UspA family protein
MQKILAVLNDFEQADRVLDTAIPLAQKEGVALEVLFVHETPHFSLSELFWQLENTSETGQRLNEDKIEEELERTIRAKGYTEPCALFVQIDDTADRVAAQTEGDKETLIIAAYHPAISEALMQACYPPLLILKEMPIPIRAITLPIELEGEPKHYIAMLRTLFPDATLRLLYDNHYLTDPEEHRKLKAGFAQLKEETGLEGDYIEEFAWNEADYGEDFDAIAQHLLDSAKRYESDLIALCSSDGNFLYSEGVAFTVLEKTPSHFLVSRHPCA